MYSHLRCTVYKNVFLKTTIDQVVTLVNNVQEMLS
jgi:hypothetical protein